MSAWEFFPPAAGRSRWWMRAMTKPAKPFWLESRAADFGTRRRYCDSADPRPPRPHRGHFAFSARPGDGGSIVKWDSWKAPSARMGPVTMLMPVRPTGIKVARALHDDETILLGSEAVCMYSLCRDTRRAARLISWTAFCSSAMRPTSASITRSISRPGFSATARPKNRESLTNLNRRAATDCGPDSGHRLRTLGADRAWYRTAAAAGARLIYSRLLLLRWRRGRSAGAAEPVPEPVDFGSFAQRILPSSGSLAVAGS